MNKALCILQVVSLVLGFAIASVPKIIPINSNVVKLEGGNYLVFCGASNNPKFKAFRWLDPSGNVIDSGQNRRIRTTLVPGLGLELLISNITQSDDGGVYSCVTPEGNVTFKLNVPRPITFDNDFAIQTVIKGQDSQVVCPTSGASKHLKIIWRVNYRRPAGRFWQQENGILAISNVQVNDANFKFVCRAINLNPQLPDMREFEVTVQVHSKPKALEGGRKKFFGVEGRWTNLTCKVNADPPASFTWKAGNSELLTTSDVVISNPMKNKSILMVLIRGPTDFGRYVCRATNSVGRVDQTLTLLRGNKPKRPRLSVGQLESTTANLRVTMPTVITAGNEEEILPVIGYMMQVKRSQRENWAKADVILTSDGFIMTNLTSNVTYYVRAAAQNEAATGDYSDELEFTTTLEPDLIIEFDRNSDTSEYFRRPEALAFKILFFLFL